ncbi:glycosyltransferase [Streptomyces sp. CHA1]|uniref:glycosyltransferase family 4 protein n=1 Tax=unclassified Streptomyces TaxID=2593676 RepID=UPI001BFC54E9|nr:MULTISPECIES: glycosyltransferase family 4 protein [unclassified Streptomyces]MBT3156831.1 glycosyltransferase [Streptomyces sp. G11C]MCO6700077.1 glycosyltransferase [Streptomyces sp. CHB9.2]MCO6706225.1 glycosyltransferase [Streptomyces sp. CHA3]MCO6711962.1 glycosyltransferase [Streptomyces sp. CHB19.2]MCO6718395.1 glycosyltransferase [Streptomyces sp. Vc714c-19]
MKIAFLINNAYGIGGTIRAVVNLSGALAATHEVEVVSVHRVQDEPSLPLDGRVTLTSLIDMRRESVSSERDHPSLRQPSVMFRYPDAIERPGRISYSALHDERIEGWLCRTDADVVIATRPDLNGYLVRYGRSSYVRIGQEHLSRAHLSPVVREHQNRAVRELDAFVTVSEADAADYRAANPDARARILCIPNGVPQPAVEPSTLDSNVIVAAGRLVGVKRYDRLIDAFALLASDHPAWSLRIYGGGTAETKLRRRIKRLGLYDRVFLMGPVSPIETEWAKGAIAAVSSDFESFGMTIVEAMHCGVPVVATDCPHGPAEIIHHGDDGLLVPLEAGVEGYAQALDRLMSDADLRASMGKVALQTAAAYAPHNVVHHYESLFRQFSHARTAPQPDKPKAPLWSRLRTVLSSRAEIRDAEEPVESPRRKKPRPTARVKATPDGSVSVRLERATLPSGPLDFIARLRHDPEQREIRIPVPLPDADADADTGGGLSEIVLHPDEHDLTEGRWNCYISSPGTDAKPKRLLCAMSEQARLVGRMPVLQDGRVTAWIPHTATDGTLAIRAWQRPAHAEVTGWRVSPEGAVVTARLLAEEAVRLLEEATVIAVSREGAEYDFTLPPSRFSRSEAEFTFTIPFERALELRSVEHDVWDLRLSTGEGHPLIPVGRIGGDIIDRKRMDTVPAVRLVHPARGLTRTRPFYTVGNDLALSLRDAEIEA